MNLFSLKDKVIVVTGGAGVLGSSFVEAITEAKGTAIILGRNLAKAEALAARIKRNGGGAYAISLDVLNQERLLKARDEILAVYGRIDGLVNAAGGNIPEAVVQPQDSIFSLNFEAMQQAMHLNVFGTILPIQIFGPEIAKTKNGSIVNISSVSAKRALTKVLGYSMGKAALDCYTKWFSVELANRFGDTIRINSITPGFFLTEQNQTLLTKENGDLTERGEKIQNQTPFRRFGRPDELKGALVYFLSDASRFVSGTEIVVDGGFSQFSGV